MKLSLKAGTTSKLLDIFIQDSSSTTGLGLTGLVYNTASLTAYYYREGAASAVAITLATMTLGTWATGGFVVVDGTNLPGVYQLGIPDGALAAGAKSVLVMLKGAANMAPVVLEIELTAVDNQDAAAFGITRMDAAMTSRMASYTQPTGFLAATFPTGTIANTSNITTVGAVSGAVGSVTGNVGGNVTGSVGSVAAGGIVAASFGAAALGGVWDIVLASHLTAGTTGAALNAAGSAGDPWVTSLPGAYSVGSAGYIVGNNLNATVSSRSTYAGGDTSGVTTLLTRIGGSITITAGKVDVNDKTGFALSSAGIQAIWDALTSALTTVGSVGKRIADFITGDAYTRIGTNGAGLTALGDARLANLDATVSSRMATFTYTLPLDAAGTRAALGMASANFDTQISGLATSAQAVAIKAKTDNLPADPAAASNIAALNDITVAEIIAGVTEGSLDFQEMMRLILAACVGKSSGHENGLPRYRDQADTKNRIAATTDVNGNRTAVIVDGT